PELVERLWNVLEGLDNADVEGNSFVDQIQLGATGSYYDPSADDIGISRKSLPKGNAYDRGWFEQVVLHEVGHAVHARHQEDVDDMLNQLFGWQRLPKTTLGITQWIEEMGGYPPGATEREQQQIRSFIRQAVGDGWRWTAPARPTAPPGHPWHAEGFAPRVACESSSRREQGKRWYDFSGEWYRYGDRRFFVNYYYAELMIVGEAALDYVKNEALDPYALMAPPEFFAELYMTIHAKNPARHVERLDPLLVEYVQSLGKEALPSVSPPAPTKPEGDVDRKGQDAKVKTVAHRR
ncbi:MAG: hypothetical protein ACREOQ_03100, partial [Gemmatimonadales bacterium]